MRIVVGLATVTILLGGLACARTATAFGPPGDPVQLRTVAFDFGDCVVRRVPDQAIVVVRDNLENGEITRRFPRLSSQNCMGRATDDVAFAGVSFSGPAFRHMLGEALIRAYYTQTMAIDLSAAAPLTWETVDPLDPAELASMPQRQRDEATDRHRNAQGWRALSLFGECVARRDPDAARRIAATAPASPAEAAMLTELRPAMAACIDADSTLRLRRDQVRSATSYAYIRLMLTAQPPVIGNARTSR